ncbi:FtsB family cell division protein [Thiohalorhabdus sp. Cl-TMA]|uniref:Cell division protein FtsB n=1 Tax=Thiohalorhabdus methylotrophus TaxID=3242694 RepID=A0ABV4TWN4_9GAMM
MRIGVVVLAVLLLGLQYSLWLGERNLRDIWERRAALRDLKETVERFEARNRQLRAEVEDLRREGAAIAERAREDLGMIREGEIFIRIVRPRNGASTEEDGGG